MHDQCSLLYRKDMRDEIKKLRGAKKEDLESLQNHLFCKKIKWYKKNQIQLGINNQDLVLNGYEIIIYKLEVFV